MSRYVFTPGPDVMEARAAGQRASNCTTWKPNRTVLSGLRLFGHPTEIYFANGHLFLEGGNGTGKSATMAMIYPLLFTLSTAYTDTRKDDKPNKDQYTFQWYLEDGAPGQVRVGFGCLEWVHPDGRVFVHGFGARLSIAQKIDIWGFTLPCSIDNLDIVKDGHCLDKAAMQSAVERLGGHFFTKRRSTSRWRDEYRAAIAETLYGLSLQQYDAILDATLEYRQPNHLSKVTPGESVQAIRDSLVPVDQAEYLRASEVYITALRRQSAIQRKIALIGNMHDWAVRVQRYVAAKLANERDVLEGALVDLRLGEDRLEELRAEAEGVRQKIARLEVEAAEAAESLRINETLLEETGEALAALEGDGALEREMVHAQRMLDGARRSHNAAIGTRKGAESALLKAEGRLRDLTDEHARVLESVTNALKGLMVHASQAHWPEMIRATNAASSDSSNASGLVRLSVEASQRAGTLKSARRLITNQDAAARDLNAAQDRLTKAVELVASAQALADHDAVAWRSAAKGYWSAAVTTLRGLLDEDLAEGLEDAVPECEAGDSSVLSGILRDLLAASAEAAVERLSQTESRLVAELALVQKAHSASTRDLDILLGTKDLEYPRSRGCTLAREKLAEVGLAGIPLHTLLRGKDDRAGQVEQALQDAGILDLLYLAPSDRLNAFSVLEEFNVAEKIWQPTVGGNLHLFLEPDPAARLDEATVREVIDGTALHIDRDGRTWRYASIRGFSEIRDLPVYLGAESRKEFRLREIQRLEAQVEFLSTQAHSLSDALAEVRASKKGIRSTMENALRIPKGSDLAQADVAVRRSATQLSTACSRVDDAHATVQDCQARLANAGDGLRNLMEIHDWLSGVDTSALGGLADAYQSLRRDITDATRLLDSLAAIVRRKERAGGDVVDAGAELQVAKTAEGEAEKHLSECEATHARILGMHAAVAPERNAILDQRRDAERAIRYFTGAEASALGAVNSSREHLGTLDAQCGAQEMLVLQRTTQVQTALSGLADLLRHHPRGTDVLAFLDRGDIEAAVKALTEEAWVRKSRSSSIAVPELVGGADVFTVALSGAHSIPVVVDERGVEHPAYIYALERAKEAEELGREMNSGLEDAIKDIANGRIRRSIIDALSNVDRIIDVCNTNLANACHGAEGLRVEMTPTDDIVVRTPTRTLTGRECWRIFMGHRGQVRGRNFEMLNDDAKQETLGFLRDVMRTAYETLLEAQPHHTVDMMVAEELSATVQKLLDYRSWLDVKMDVRSMTQSGLVWEAREKIRESTGNEIKFNLQGALVRLSLLSAGARPDAPRFLVIDEANDAIDLKNREQILDFFENFEFSWLLASNGGMIPTAKVKSAMIYEFMPSGGGPVPIFPKAWQGGRVVGGLVVPDAGDTAALFGPVREVA